VSSLQKHRKEEVEKKVLMKTLYAYDIISRIALLEETYKIYKDVFFDKEKFKREIKHHHTEFLQAMNELPKNVSNTEDHKFLETNNKIELISKCENAWDKFRDLMTKSFMVDS